MLDRRSLLRALSLSALAVGAAPLLAACGDDPGKPTPPAPGGDTELGLVSSDVRRAEAPATAVPAASASVHALGAGLYGQLATEPGNLALSPYSVAVALAMTQNGAVGETRTQMLDVMDADDDALNEGLNALTVHIESLAGTQKRADGTEAEVALDAANALFGEETMTFEEPFLDTLAREYGAGMRTVDYVGATEAARTAINEWTAKQTHDRIEEIIPPDLLDVTTRLVLVNAIYLKAPWERPFEKDLTEDAPFHLEDGSTVSVPMMRPTDGPIALGKGDGWQAVPLPYAGGRVAMTVVLPDEGRLADVEAQVVAGGLPEILASPKPEGVGLLLPKWTFRTDAALGDALMALGMTLPFEAGNADFSAMTTEADLYISAVLHQAFIAVDEEGTEAAAATAVVMMESSAPQLTPVVVDRPFLFVIHDVEHGTPLFVGRVSDPSA
ncbi:serine/threonine protein kinase [Nocardioides szechwanensis]|uniref:Serpin B n=1 Tax=Nocardioides szechwanensis TaxID=1005944 RepID=A0A1G9ZYD8_9ACTN|nr:serpin family protein [Nocardioides szechwanensis]GEP36051.1 serine/threonine protein kinase [Nocardioides szechwanensis]SDN26479.1 serpin B [Nocardioides szechwanensis]